MYSEFANVYDALMRDADYTARSKYLLSLFEKFDRKPTLLLDLACGTGGFSNEFSKEGVQVIGVDVSAEMLSIARENSMEQGQDVLYLCQNATELDLYGTVDGAICCLDSLNHITDYDDFKAAIGKVSLFLEPERLFIFDVNTIYKHEIVLGNNTIVKETDDVYCVWQNEYNEGTHTTDINLDFFVCEDGVYYRSDEHFCERAYTDTEIAAACGEALLEIIAVFDEMTENPTTDKTERAVYITRKR